MRYLLVLINHPQLRYSTIDGFYFLCNSELEWKSCNTRVNGIYIIWFFGFFVFFISLADELFFTARTTCKLQFRSVSPATRHFNSPSSPSSSRTQFVVSSSWLGHSLPEGQPKKNLNSKGDSLKRNSEKLTWSLRWSETIWTPLCLAEGNSHLCLAWLVLSVHLVVHNNVSSHS